MAVSEIVLFLGLGAVALYGRHIILYVGAFIGLLLWGLHIADTVDLMYGVAICLCAFYFMWRSYEVWFGR